MSLWDDDEILDEIQINKPNKYLVDAKNALKLIADITQGEKASAELSKLDYLLDHALLKSLGQLNISNELEIRTKLNKLSEQIEQYKKIQALSKKTIIGLGGKFSAGKSSFVNSILNADLLPESLTPTTSIPTYIINGEDNITAYTIGNKEISLDNEALQALTHAFHEQYQLGFAAFINCILIKQNKFKYDNIAILDTPGYTKFDASIKKTMSDEKKAFGQLKACDYLIWLIDIENGIIQNNDIEFISSLGIKTPILIVFNKADKKTNTQIEEIVTNTKNVLSSKGNLNIFGVTAFSSLNEGTEYLDQAFITDFLEDASKYAQEKEDIEAQFTSTIHEINQIFDELTTEAINERNYLGDIITNSTDVLNLRGSSELYKDSLAQIDLIKRCKQELSQNNRKIKKSLSTLIGEGEIHG
ncbi:MAG: hypothetical protein ATN36_06480 [Epulopiscium sp. Nele67-Bin005]|nr:MAG: hypothetical protein ATN36_06480 [Epulopiscium sp. Nele67-Bin005]